MRKLPYLLTGSLLSVYVTHGAALLKGLLTSRLAGLPGVGGLVFYRRVRGDETWMGSLTGPLVTGSRDGTARARNLATRLASLILVPSAGGAATPDGTWLGSGDPGEWFWSAAGFTRAPL
jgi:hypothetical protein